jgi:Uncharacterized conserved protein (DUF2249)
MDKSVSYFLESLNVPSTNPPIADLRELEAPEPMERVLMACAGLKAGDVYLARVPHVPVPLFPHLESRGLKWRVHEGPGQGVLLAVFRN